MKTAWRGRFAQFLLLAGLVGITTQLVAVQVVRAPELQAEARNQAVHQVRIPAIRGPIVDRDGAPLAVSTPVPSVYANPSEVRASPKNLRRLADALDMEADALRRLLARESPFVYLERQVAPRVAERVEELGLPGVSTLREYRRYYPAGPVAAHVVGLAGIDGGGLEGVELAYDDTLAGRPGERLVERDALGRDIRTVRVTRPVKRGQSLRLSIDGRLQYVAFQAVKKAVSRRDAKAGMAVVLDPDTGEVLALANVPSYNPNRLEGTNAAQRRNRAVTDALEPGSIFKPFNVAAALEEGLVQPSTVINCEQGLMRVDNRRVHDPHPLGQVSVRKVIQKSSNIGAAKIALQQDNAKLWRHLRDFGFGLEPGSGFPGESQGILHMPGQWQRFDRATLGFGHGIAVSALQMARAYTVLANGGIRRPITLRRQEEDKTRAGERVLTQKTAGQVKRMLDMVVSPEGTGTRASLSGYGVAGKTGTAQKPGEGGYQEGKYVASFAGFAPVADPSLVTVVMLDEPSEPYYGGVVAAPVFREIMAQGLRLRRVPPNPNHRTGPPPVPRRQARGPEVRGGQSS
ncbi:peptidoglycan D,D-transpeptidase FtsI family protein [Thiohalorhabdus sp.]|uniref:peptidoglycan D,D-transpeptidase FtsI family protein n=1 Tax=Thiohalorhabdus sp. TaxID=3094134 RepID=UPI002FC34DB6